MFVMDYYGHKLSNGVLFAHHLILDVPGGSSHLGYRRRVRMSHNPRTRVKRYLDTSFLYIIPLRAMRVPTSTNTILPGKIHCNYYPLGLIASADKHRYYTLGK